jgi:hypothetical protein
MRLSLWILTLSLLALAGCRSTPPESGGNMGFPAAGNIRCLVKKVKEDARTVHWKWSFVGERNWTRFENSAQSATVTGSYPLNSPDHVGGTNVFEFDLVVERVAGSETELRVETILHASTAAGSRSAETLEMQRAPLNALVTIHQTKEDILRLPAEMHLASVGKRKILLKITE